MEKACIRRRGKRRRREEPENSKVITTIIAAKSVLGPVMNHVPDCILYEILLKLPGKTLVRFKLVSKSWHDLISSPQFVISHLALNTIKGKENKSTINYFHISGVDKETACLSILDPQASQVKTVCLKNYPIDTCRVAFSLIGFFKLIGSCNGLILVKMTTFSCLWNPSTGEYRKLASDAYRLPDQMDIIKKNHISGLGYDSILKDYKAVILCNNQLSSQRTYMYLGSMDTTNIHWRRLNVSNHDFPYRISAILAYPGVTINGSPHWVVSDYDVDSNHNNIIYFDMAEEKVKSLATPHTASSRYSQTIRNLALSILGSCLSAAYSDYTECSSVIWVMKEYGVKESWTKLFVIPRYGWSPIGFINKGAEIILETRGGLLDKASRLMSYNLKTKKIKFVLSAKCRTGAIFFESLISP